MTWDVADGLSDAEVESRLFRQIGRKEPAARAPIDFNWVHLELRRAGVTRQLLWTEYQEAVATSGTGKRSYQYSQFCDLYEEYRAKQRPSMRQVHRAGEKAFIDFSGKRPRIVDGATGAIVEGELFVMVLGASNYTYAEATRTQGLADFVGATVRGLEYFGGVPEMLVPDQLKSAVTKADRVEPEINATYAEMAQHYATAVVPARPRKPKDKAKVEGGVLVAQRWILACLRNRRFFSLEELNAAIWELLEKLNTRPFQKLEGCRRSTFEVLDRPALKSLPARRYELGTWKLKVGVNIDYHFEYDHRVYSVPSTLMNTTVDVRATATVVEAWRGGVRVASHERSHGPMGTAVTKPEHRPRAHCEWGNWPPERLVAWAAQTGPKTAEVVAAILDHRTHPETGRRACLGLMLQRRATCDPLAGGIVIHARSAAAGVRGVQRLGARASGVDPAEPAGGGAEVATLQQPPGSALIHLRATRQATREITLWAARLRPRRRGGVQRVALGRRLAASASHAPWSARTSPRVIAMSRSRSTWAPRSAPWGGSLRRREVDHA